MFLTALQARILSRRKIDRNWYRYSIDVVTFYRRPRQWSARYNPTVILVPAADQACRCPRLRVDGIFLLVGSSSNSGTVPDDSSSSPGGPVSNEIEDKPGSSRGRRRKATGPVSTSYPGLVLDRNSIAVTWSDSLASKLKQFARSDQC